MTTRIQLSPDQEQKLRELGSYLREIRLQRSMTIESIALRTRIQARLLRAIEVVDTRVLPEPVYVRALIKQYAEALDLDGDRFASAFPGHDRLEGLMPSWKHLHLSRRHPFRLYLIYILALISLVSGVSILMKRSALEAAGTPDYSELGATANSTATSPGSITSEGVGILAGNRASETQVGVSAARASAPPTDRGSAATATAETNGKNVVVSLKLEDTCWLRIVADGKVAFEGTLSKGEQRTWKADEQITIVAGNAGGVAIAFNNQKPQPLGEPGAVQTVTYRPGNASSQS